jgi:hypothetical protein
MHAYRGRPHHGDTALVTNRARLGVEIVEHFHVVRDETDRHDHHLRARIHFAQHISHIRLEPRLIGRTAPALIHQAPGRNPDAL